MGKMTPRRARARPDHRGWTIDTSSSGLPSALGCPQRQGSREIPEQEGQEPETRAFWKLVCLPLPSFEAPSSLVARHLRVWGAGFCWVHWGPWSEAELWGLGAWVPGKGLPSATKWLWLPAPKTSVDPYGSHWLHGEHESGGSAPALGSWNRWLVGQARRRGWKACLWARLTEPSLSMWGTPEER